MPVVLGSKHLPPVINYRHTLKKKSKTFIPQQILMKLWLQLVDIEIYISCDIHDITSITYRVIAYVVNNRLLAVIAYFLVQLILT